MGAAYESIYSYLVRRSVRETPHAVVSWHATCRRVMDVLRVPGRSACQSPIQVDQVDVEAGVLQLEEERNG